MYKAVDVEERDIYVMGPGMFEKMVAAFRSRLKKAYLQRDDEQAAPSGLVGSAWAEEQRRKKEMSPQVRQPPWVHAGWGGGLRPVLWGPCCMQGVYTSPPSRDTSGTCMEPF